MILKLFWPEICPFCGKVSRKGICKACQKKVNNLLIEQPICMKCGKPVRKEEQEYCSDCASVHHYFDEGRALWLHKPPVNQSIYQFKYHNQRSFGEYYARKMYERYERKIRVWKPDVIVPIPLHRKRKRIRGYNQSQIIAKELAVFTGIPVNSTILKRIRYTDPQKKLDHRTRKKNLSNAFQITEECIDGIKTVLLIDDIYTTGNTIDEAAKKLKQAGVQKVFFLSVSIGQGN